MWQTAKDQGRIDETTRYASLQAGQGLEITAAKGVVADIHSGNAPLAATLERLGQQPGTAWLAEIAQRDDVRWNQVAEAHESWDYHSQGLSGPGAAIVAIAVAIATQGAGSALLGAAMGAGEGAMAGTIGGAMADAAFTSLVSQASISLINNQGNIGKVPAELGSSASLRNLATSVAAAGAFNVVGTATNGHFGGAGINNGRQTPTGYFGTGNYAANVAGHAVVGGAVSLANGGTFVNGALSGGAGAALSPVFLAAGKAVPGSGVVLSSVLGGTTAALGGGDFKTGAMIAGLGYLYNEIGISLGGGVIGGNEDSFGALNINVGAVFSDWDPRSWGLFGQISLSDTAGAGSYYGGGVSVGGWVSGTDTPSGDSGWVRSREFDANAGLLGSVGGSFSTSPDSGKNYGAFGGSAGTKIGIGIGAMYSKGDAQSRNLTWRPFEQKNKDRANMKLILTSSLSVDECVIRLRESTDPPWKLWGKPVIGRVNKKSLHLRRRKIYINIVESIISAKLSTHGNLTVVSCDVGVRRSVRIFVNIWMYAFIFMGGGFSLLCIRDIFFSDNPLYAQDLFGILGFIIIFLFAVYIYKFGRWLSQDDDIYLLGFVKNTICGEGPVND